MDATPFPRYDVALTPMRFTADVTSYPVFPKIIIPSNESAPRVGCVSTDDVLCPVQGSFQELYYSHGVFLHFGNLYLVLNSTMPPWPGIKLFVLLLASLGIATRDQESRVARNGNRVDPQVLSWRLATRR